MTVFRKLVRDKIPDIIAANGEEAITRTLGKEEYFKELVNKLSEEVEEFREAKNMEELADIQEVVLALADEIESRIELDKVREQKAQSRGTFKERIFLEETK